MIGNTEKRKNIKKYVLVLLALSVTMIVPSIAATSDQPPLPSLFIWPQTAILNVSESYTFTISAVAPDQNGGLSQVKGLAIDIIGDNESVGTVSPLSVITDDNGNATVTFTAINAGHALIIAKNTSAYDAGDKNATTNASITVVESSQQNDILAYYRGLGTNQNVVETTDLLKAADDWRDNIIPSSFSISISTTELLTLADEWRTS